MDGLMIYKETTELVCRLTDEEAGMLFKAAFKYAFDREEITFDDRAVGFVYDLIKRDIDKDSEKARRIRERNKSNGAKGGRPKNPVKPNETQQNPKNPLGFLETQQNPEKPKEKERSKEREEPINLDTTIYNTSSLSPTKFKKPTVEEVKAYAAEKGYTNFNPEQFWNFYESKDWMVGKNKMANWKSAVSGWALRDKNKLAESAKPQTDYKAQLSKLDYGALLRK